MLERISRLIKSKKLSSSQFADEIGVQRSSVSHVLSGRNKPSLDFITKILETYADVDPDWLLSGKGSMFREEDIPLQDDTLPFEEYSNPKTEAKKEDEELLPPQAEIQKPPKRKTGSKSIASGDKSVAKIVLFYSDGTFREFSPDAD